MSEIGAVMTAETAEGILQRLAAYSAAIDRECEVILRTDGSGDVMAAEEFTLRGEEATGFESVAEFGSIAELREVLEARA